MNEKLYKKLIKYASEGRYPFHMPGHKRNRKMLEGKDPFELDITEIEGFDNLHHPEGIIEEMIDSVTSYYGTKKTWFLVNGSTCGILAAITACTKQGDKILIGRNCHKAVYHGILLRNLEVEYLYPKYISEFGINGGYDPVEVEQLLENHPEIKTVVLTSPTYDGIVSDIEKIAGIVHKYGGTLIIDEAHGAHFHLFENGPKPAYKLGADIVIESLHKTLPALTQSAVLHVCGDKVNKRKIEKALEIFETSSPSYILMASMEHCICSISENGKEQMNQLLEQLRILKKEAIKYQKVKMPGKDLIGKYSVFDIDETKLLFCLDETNMSGIDFSKILRERYNIEMEMETPSYILGIATICDSVEGLEKLFDAIREMDKSLVYINKKWEDYSLEKNQMMYSVYEAENCEEESVDIQNSTGRISKEYVFFYPPGIPLIVPGEIISQKVIDKILYGKKCGAHINGLEDRKIQRIKVIK